MGSPLSTRPRSLDSMAETMSYASHSQYTPPGHYYSTPHNHGHSVSPQPRAETTQRKRPKYTRSKTGCMTCRIKKIKCDESKPNCMRCSHGQRDCTWPEGIPPRKKAVVKTESSDETRPSTASSSVSESSTPPIRDRSPPRRGLRPPSDIDLPPLASRRHHGDPYLQLHPLPSYSDSHRHDRHYTPSPPMISEVDPYHYNNYHSSSRTSVHPGRNVALPSHWSTTANIDYYHDHVSDRPNLMHPSSNEHQHQHQQHHRYQ